MNLEEEFGKMVTSKGEKLSPNTIKCYIVNINTISKLSNSSQFNGKISSLLESDKIIDSIENSDIQEKSNLYSTLIRLLNHIDSGKYSQIVNDKYYPMFIKHKTDQKERIDKNTIDKDKIHRYISLEEARKRLEEFNVKHEDGNINSRLVMYKTIVSMYLLNPNWVPRNDLHTLYIAGKKDELNDEKNYLILNARNKPDHIILNHYKTARIYGKQIIKLSKEVKDVLINYLITTPRNYGDVLFPYKNNEQYKDVTFSLLVAKALFSVLHEDMTIDIIRNLHASTFSRTLHSEKEKKEFAKSLLNSSDTLKYYIKVNAPK